jgi:hypothetical protein
LYVEAKVRNENVHTKRLKIKKGSEKSEEWELTKIRGVKQDQLKITDAKLKITV